MNEPEPETVDEAPDARRLQTAIPLSTWTCSVKFNSTPEEKEDLTKDSIWGMSDSTRQEALTTEVLSGSKSIGEILAQGGDGNQMQLDVRDIAEFDGKFVYWGMDRSISDIETEY